MTDYIGNQTRQSKGRCTRVLVSTSVFNIFHLWLIISISVLFLCASAAAVEVGREDTGRAILVLDASGSMWGKVGEKTKVEIARESIKQLLDAWNPDIELGLMAYGHRREGDCNDIELVLPVERQNPQTVIKAVNRLNAKGKTPLSAAVKQAAEALRYTTDRATVILVSDGVETCGLDPCKVAEELEKSGVAFTAHVIGFDLKKEETSKLRCLADGTGGMFLEAADAASLTKALTTVEESIAAAEQAVKVPPASKFVAVLRAGTAPLENREINWRFTEPEKDTGGTYRLVEFQRDTNPQVRLGSGTYRVHVQTGLVEREASVAIDPDNPQQHEIDLQAGQMKLIGFNVEGGEQLSRNVRWYLNRESTEHKGKFDEVDYTNAASPDYTVPAGRYEVVLTSGTAQSSAVVDIAPGDVIEKNVYLNAGQVRLRAVLIDGGEQVERVTWNVHREKPGVPGTWEPLTYSSNKNPTFTLSAGKYHVIADTNAAKAEMDINVVADQLTEKEVSLAAGEVKLIAVNAATGSPLEKADWSITSPQPDANGAYQRLTYSSYYQPTFILKAGRHRVVITRGGKQSISMIDVAAGERKEVRIRVNAQ